jgi:hypothetical protein
LDRFLALELHLHIPLSRAAVVIDDSNQVQAHYEGWRSNEQAGVPLFPD